MKKIITSLKHIYSYLKDEYKPDYDAYKDFIKLYNTVEQARKTIQEKSLVFSSLNDLSAQAVKIETAINEENTKWTNGLGEYESVANQNIAKKAALNEQIAEVENEIKQNTENETSLKEYQQTIKKSKPHFWAKKAEKMLYKERLKENEAHLGKVIYEAIDLQNRLKTLKQQINTLDADIQSHKANQINHNRIIEECTGELLKINNQIASIRENCKDIFPLDMGLEYDKLQLSNPWFDEEYRVAQSKLFISALRVRKQFLYENLKNINAAIIIWDRQKEYLDKKHIISAAWDWINMTIPVISSTFASFGNMCRNLGANSIGHLFIDEAGQALPQAAVGAVFRSRYIMVVGDPSQIKPVLTLDSNFLSILRKKYDVTEKYLSDSASVQTLCDAASQYGFYREKDKSDESWIGIPLWVHRRCQYPMFSISNEISYNGLMVQGNPGYGKAEWYDIGGSAENKYVSNQADFLIEKIKEIMEQNQLIEDEKKKKTVYVISPFTNVAFKLSQKLKEINFTHFSRACSH